MVKWLLYDKKCRPGNQWSENGDTVLHRMIDRLIDNTKLNNKQIPKIIKEIMPHFKCNLVMKNKEGNTPLHVCCAPLQQISKAKRQYYTEWIHSMIELMKDHPMSRFFMPLQQIIGWGGVVFLPLSVIAVDDRHIAFCDFRGGVAKTVCVTLTTLAEGNFLLP